MLSIQKKIGETPLEMLDRLRVEKPEYKNHKLSYAGRLDPMAYGEMLVLVGDENKKYKDYLGYDKEYEATFIFGFETDTGDILGILKNSDNLKIDDDFFLNENIQEQIENFKKIKKQKYPWFSSMVVDGLKLFDHFKKGNLNIERPDRKVDIKEIELVESGTIKNVELQKYIFENIGKVKGDFRQKEIKERWHSFFNSNDQDFYTAKVRILVSTGTYIRSLTEEFEHPATLLKLRRTKIYV
jgi:tRNA pseudouridine(55) synthase